MQGEPSFLWLRICCYSALQKTSLQQSFDFCTAGGVLGSTGVGPDPCWGALAPHCGHAYVTAALLPSQVWVCVSWLFPMVGFVTSSALPSLWSCLCTSLNSTPLWMSCASVLRLVSSRKHWSGDNPGVPRGVQTLKDAGALVQHWDCEHRSWLLLSSLWRDQGVCLAVPSSSARQTSV